MNSIAALHLVSWRPSAQMVLGALGAALLVLLGPGRAGADTIAADDPNIQYVGRFDQTTPTAPAFDWSHSCIRANFQGTSCSVILDGISKYFDVYVDGGNPWSVMSGNSGVETLPVVSGLSNGVHAVALYRRDEAGKGLNTFLGFVLDTGKALVAPDAPPFRRMEFIGDSYTCGYGVLGAYGSSFSYATEDACLSYAGLMASHYHADCMVTAWTGEGMVRNYGDPNQTSAYPLPYYYPRTCGSVSNSATWTFNWQPDVVVINLGLNDFFTSPQPTEAQFVGGYSNFLTTVRGYYPNADIICTCLCQMLGSAGDYISTVVSTFGDRKVHFAYIDYVLMNPTDLGSDEHPNTWGQTIIADAFIPVFDGIMGASWAYSPPQLQISLSPPNALVFAWSFPIAGCLLQTNASLAATNWVTLANAPVASGSNYQMTMPAPAGLTFYRLKLP